MSIAIDMQGIRAIRGVCRGAGCHESGDSLVRDRNMQDTKMQDRKMGSIVLLLDSPVRRTELDGQPASNPRAVSCACVAIYGYFFVTSFRRLPVAPATAAAAARPFQLEDAGRHAGELVLQVLEPQLQGVGAPP